MILDNLPVEWLSLQLKDIGNIYTGKTPSSKDVDNFDGDIPFVKPGDLDKGGYIFNTSTHISSPALASLPNLPANSIMVTCIGNMGKVGITTEVSATNQQINSIVPFKEFINYKYIYYYCLTLKNWLDRESSATTIAIVNKGRFSEAPIPLPPLAEQQEIVRQLDVMLAQVEQIKARLDAIPAILKKFRQSVLADAVSGKLTEEWRNSNEKNSEPNFESYISDYRIQKYLEWEKESLLRKGKKIPSDEILLKKYKPTLSEEITQEGLPHGWSRQLLDGLIYISARIGWKGLKAEEYTEEGPLFLSVHGLNYGKVVRLDQAFHISQERYDESPEIALKNDDILLCKDGAGIGKVGIVKGLDEPASINSSLLLIRSGEIFVPEFLYYVFKGPYIQKLVQERLTGTAIPHLFQRDIKEFLLDLPPLDEQKLIVEKVEAYFNWVEKIENTVQTAQKRVKLLTQSILAKAFSGELTAEWREQHQDLITGVNSAESLLVKIQAEREASKPVKKAKKAKTV